MLDSLSDPPQFITFPFDQGRQENWSQYVEKFLGSDETAHLDPKKSRVFLKRYFHSKKSSNSIKERKENISLDR